MTSEISKRTMLKGTAGLVAMGSMPARADNDSYPRIMQGPMIGPAGDREIVIWGRLSGAFPVEIEISEDAWFSTSRRTAPITPNAEDDFVFTVRIDGLKPDTAYYYRVFVNNGPDKYLGDLPPMRTKTAPRRGARIRIAYGSCARFQAYPEQKIWPAVSAAEPDIFLWLGDNIYVDAQHKNIFSDEYKRQRDVRELQPLIQSVPQLAIWDDHDFGLNDSNRNNPVKDLALDMFKRFWPNPAYGTADTPGCFFAYQYGGLDFFMLDSRMYRSPNDDEDGPAKTMLGASQFDWLKQRLRESRAPFKLVACGSGWSAAKGPRGDSWAAFIHERNAFFDFIRDEKVSGVVLLSGDTHVAELNCIPRSQDGGYDLYDLVSSPLAQASTDSWLVRRPELRIRQVYFGGPNFGLIDVSLKGEPTLRFEVRDVYGRPVWAPFEIKAGALRNGVSSWREKIDSVSLERRESAAEDGFYYRP